MAFTAMYAGVCDTCDESIKVGQEIQSVGEARHGVQPYEHVKCPTPVVDLTSGKPCSRCFLIHAGECF